MTVEKAFCACVKVSGIIDIPIYIGYLKQQPILWSANFWILFTLVYNSISLDVTFLHDLFRAVICRSSDLCTIHLLDI